MNRPGQQMFRRCGENAAMRTAPHFAPSCILDALTIHRFNSSTLRRASVRRSSENAGGFTLVELLIVIAIIAILAAILLPVLQKAENRAQEATCISNQKQLATAWVMYAGDTSDACACNNWGTEKNWATWQQVSPGTNNWMSGWMGADGSGGDGSGSTSAGGPDNTNTDLLIDPKYASLGDYTKNPRIYLCPTSKVVGPTTSGGPKNQLLCRSVSMNCWVGVGCAPSDTGGTLYYKTTTIAPGISPSDLYVFVEERGESIDDGNFAVYAANDSANYQYIFNWATDYHDGASTFGFADGHAQTHRWLVPITFSDNGEACGMLYPQQPIITAKWGKNGPIPAREGADVQWLEHHATFAPNPLW